MFKLSGWVWIVAGLFLGLAVFSYAYFQHYKPDKQEAENLEAYYAQLEDEFRKDQATKDRIDQAIADVEEIAAEWRDEVAAKMVNDDAFIPVDVDPWQLVVNTPGYRNTVQRAVNRQVKSGGVTVVQGPLVPFPGGEPGLMASYFNYGSGRLLFPVVVYELGTVTVRGSLSQIMANVEAWTNMPDYWAVADGLTLSGTDNDLTGAYNVVILGYVPGAATGPLGAATGASDDGAPQLNNAGITSGSTGGGEGSIPAELGGGGAAAGGLAGN